MDASTLLLQALVFVAGLMLLLVYFSNKREKEYQDRFKTINKEIIELILKVLTKDFQTREELWQNALKTDTEAVLLNVYEEQFRMVLEFMHDYDTKEYKVIKQYVDLSKTKREFSTKRENFTFEYRLEE